VVHWPVVLKNKKTHRTAEIGWMAWSVVVASLARFEITVAPARNPKTAEALSSLQSSSIDPLMPPRKLQVGIHKYLRPHCQYCLHYYRRIL
jgi:hypothetical protein